MPLYKRPSTDFIPALRWAATTGVWTVWDDVDRQMVEIPGWTAVVDFQYPKTGWMKFASGSPPDFVWDQVAGQAGPQPGKDYRHGIAVNLYDLEHLGGVREICSTSGGLCEALSVAFDEYERSPQVKAGLLPVIQTGATKPFTNRHGSFFDPSLEIVDWVPRPPELPEPPPTPADHLAGAVIPGLDKDLDDSIPF